MSVRGGLRSVLIVDDDAQVLQLLHEIFASGGYHCRLATNGQEALDAFAGERPPLTVTDVKMPVMDGLEFVKRAHALDPDAAVLVLTGVGDVRTAVESLTGGAYDFILKPVNPRELLQAAERALDHREQLAERREQHEMLERRIAEATRELDAMQHQLEESEERYTLSVRGVRDGLWDWNLRTGELYLSPRWKELLGYGEHEVGATPEEWLGRVHPDEIDRFHTQLLAHVEGRTAHFEFEHRLRHRDGAYRWMVARGLAARGGDEQAHRMAGSLTDISGRKNVEEELVRNALFDGLTQLPSRAMFENRLERAMRIARRRPDYRFAVLFLDIDRFKLVNDSLGHAAGDQLLHAVAGRLAGCVRPADTVARFGGDEFAILLEDVEDQHEAAQIAEQILEGLSEAFPIGGHELVVTASIGLVLSSPAHKDPGAYLRSADAAMYRAKSLGRARWEAFDHRMHARSLELLTLERELRQALERSEFVLHYQPVVALASRLITGCEALVRWSHPRRGLLLPGDFIPLAEETGLIVPIGNWVLRTACGQLQEWLRAGLPQLDLAVNLSARQFNHRDLDQVVATALRQSGLDPRLLKLELTESMVMAYSEQTLRTIETLRLLGIELSIDDFGTGYSSLAYLKRFPCRSLKIDRSFVRGVTTDPDDAAIATAIISLAHNLKMKVIAEGIETEEQRQFLERERCDEGQGYLFSRPVPASEFVALLARFRVLYYRNRNEQVLHGGGGREPVTI